MKLLAYPVLACLVAGCKSDRIAGPANLHPAASSRAAVSSHDGHARHPSVLSGAPGLKVMTYNVYLGTDLGPILRASSDQEFVTAAYRAYAELLQTNFPERAGKIADQIAALRPDIVGLDEVALWSVSSPMGAPFEVRYDFLKLVIDSLKTRHLQYTAASADTTSDVAAPVPTAFDEGGNPTAFDMVRFQDRDAILVRAGVRFGDPQHGRFSAFIPLNLLGTATGLYRGWCSIRATVGGRTFRYVNSHLEAESPDVNLAQANEMVSLLETVSDPVIWAGDFNADATSAAATFALTVGAGFTDLWPIARPDDPGLTNGPADGVGALNAAGVLVPYTSLVFNARVDVVLLRDRDGKPDDVNAAIFGVAQSDRTASGLFPSDHAAVGMVFELPKAGDLQ